MHQILSIKIFVVIILVVFNDVIKLHDFDVTRLHDGNDYVHKMQDMNNHFVMYK